MARVLVVDDALMMRKTIGTFLVKAGHVVVEEAANGKQAVIAYKTHRPDLVTMDITMPGVDGIEALKQIIAFDSKARVVMVSALGQKHKVFDALQHGAKGYILKPFTEDKLSLIVNDLLGTGRHSEIPSEQIAACAAKPLTAQMAFSLESQEEGVRITPLREFTNSDYDDMAKAMQNIKLGKDKEIIIDFTCGNVLNHKTALAYEAVITEFTACGGSVRIVCHTRDYTTYFRNLGGLQAVEFELMKKYSVQ